MFDVNGHRLYLECQGTAPGSTIVLIAGGGGTAGTWNKVQTPISQFARVCSYDRQGLGKSEATKDATSQSVAQIVSDLEGLLSSARIPPPYILVGHSIGGLYARAFDEQDDSRVAGMVLLDSSHEEQIWRFAEGEPEALSEYPRWKDQQFMSSQGFLPPHQRLAWHFAKPLIVIEHGLPPEPIWHQMQQDLASRSPESRFITATQSSHYIQRFQPKLVIDSVRSVFQECKLQPNHIRRYH